MKVVGVKKLEARITSVSPQSDSIRFSRLCERDTSELKVPGTNQKRHMTSSSNISDD